MSNFNTRMVIPVFSGSLGALWLIYGLIQYGWWGDNGPQSGFFPALVGALLILVSIFALFNVRKQREPGYASASLLPAAGVIAVVISAFLIGFFPALFLFVLGWIKLYEKYPWSKSLAAAAITIGLFYGIFALWLRVPFPEGLIIEAVRG